ncbi:putative Zn-dependent protease [Hamadaea flava]|uniref:TldD/PmbA family protein n=1 Tax=Hamadaea flava TaxID=1742688 RepID=A0ABV8LI30_9ACTN|nr:TldD/PmbA family protein [Hamadaea flava]MCP2325408.1 putative Zn-dependent protease [Hamadaea flava]
MSSSLADLAHQVLDLVRTAAPTAEAAVSADRTEQWLTRFATSFIHQNVADETTSVTLTVHVDGRTTVASTTLTDDAGLRALVERTVGATRLAPLDAAWPGLVPPASLAGTGTVDQSVLAATPDDRAGVVQAFVRAAGGLETAGYCRTKHWTGAYANSAGHFVEGEATSADFDGIARNDGADSAARISSTRMSDLDGAALGDRVGRNARTLASAIELPAGEYEVVLMPEAVADILTNFAFYGFNGKQHNEGRSFARLGEAQFDPAITLTDDPVTPGNIGQPYDAEGTPRGVLSLVDAGVTAAVAHDRRTAAKAEAASTGHFSEGGWGPMTENLVLSPGSTPLPDLIRGVRRGLLVTDFWYTRVLDPRQMTLTGLTRNGVWLIEDGEIGTPVQNFRFTQAYPQALAPGRVLGVGDTAVAQPSRWGLGSWTGPALRLASWNFTGTASG